MYRKATLRRLPEVTRAVARQINAAELALSRLKRMLPKIQQAENEAIAFWNQGRPFDPETLRTHDALFPEEATAGGESE